MKKISEFVRKNENICIILLIVFSLFGVVFYISLGINDELWNFQNIYKMYNGFQIYEDANVICTPLFFYIGNLLFNFLGANFFVFRIYNILIFIIYYYFIYKILRELKINIKFSTIIVLLLIMYKNYSTPKVMANYNSLALAISLFGIYWLIKSKCEIDNKNIIIQSIICFLVNLTKQNIGIYYFVALTIIILFKSKKNRIKIMLKEAFIFVILAGIFLIFLYTNGLLEGFINYTITGIISFAKTNVSINVYYIIIEVLTIIINLSITTFLIRQKKIEISLEEKNNMLILNCFAILMAFIVYPIVNEAHFMFSIIISIILLIYLINIILKKGEIYLKRINYVISIIFVCIIFIDIIINILKFLNWSKEVFNNKYFYTYKKPYFGVIITDEMYNNIDVITNYIEQKEKEGKDVIIFSSKAALYMVPEKQSNGFYDLPFNGNFGSLNEQEIFDKLKERENVLILLEKNEDSINWQENKNIIQKIKKEFNYIEDIEEFEIYAVN